MISNAAFTELKDLLKSGQTDQARDLLLALQAGYFTLMEENRHLGLRVQTLEHLLGADPEHRLRMQDNLLMLDTDKGQCGPFCPMCHAADKSLILLEKDRDKWLCPSCEAEFAKKDKSRDLAVVLPFRKTCEKLGL